MKTLVAGFGCVLLGLASLPMVHADDPKEAAAAWNQSVEKGIAFLRTSQAEDGSFSGDLNIGITGIVVTALLKTGKVDQHDPMIAKALKYIERLRNAKEGHIAGNNPKQQLKNYVTAVNIMALAAANTDGRYAADVAAGAKFLIGLQWDEDEGKSSKDVFYGGFGYDSKNRPDLSNSSFALEALQAAAIPQDSPAYKKATLYISRCQNLKGEYQDQPWAGKVNDGSFIYSPLETKANADPNNANPGPGYASMTYAGIKSMIYAGVDKNDRRVQEALNWIKKNYSVEKNVGMPKGREKQGLYYSYHTMAKCLSVVGLDTIETPDGVKHDWRKELTLQLAKTQRPDGSWINEKDQARWMEGDPNLVTAYALLALSYSQPK
jgi:squalene-hopene/tetraprenyl-beta-curcumene cyclase